MTVWNREIQKIGIWLLLPTFMAVSIILPAAGPPAILAESFGLIVILQIVSAVCIIALLRICAGRHAAIRPRSPPIS